MSAAAQALAAAIARWREAKAPHERLLVAIDGHGGAGKSTLAEQLQSLSDVVVVHTDDFFRPAAEQPRAAALDPRAMARYYDWQRLREALAALGPARVVVLEGVSSAAPALADLVDRAVLVKTPLRERLARLHARVTPEEWDEQWLAGERDYFASLPRDRFDLTVSGS